METTEPDETKLNRNLFEIKIKPSPNPPSKFRRKIWQIIPAICASLICVPYGLALGWPSPTYPTLIEPEAPIWLSMDQTAMVTGFLMLGNAIGSPFTGQRRIDSKYGVIVSAILMTMGWMVLWQARDVYWLLASRLLVGAGNGFGIGQLKYYISEICEDNLAKILIKQINVYVAVSMILSFAFGPFVDFRLFSIISTVISILILFLAIFLPSTPRELIKNGKFQEAKKLMVFLSPHLNVEDGIGGVKECLHCPDVNLGFCDLFRESSLRKNFMVFTFLVFFQQYSGAPATLVYAQIFFSRVGSSHSELCALLYSVAFLLAYIYGVFSSDERNKRRILILSSLGVSLMLLIVIVVIINLTDQLYWNFTSLVILLLFIIIHTVGLGTVPVSLIPDLFPKEAHQVILQFFVIFHSIAALTITKIFQVMITQIGIYSPFCLFLTVSSFALIFVIIFVPSQQKST